MHLFLLFFFKCCYTGPHPCSHTVSQSQDLLEFFFTLYDFSTQSPIFQFIFFPATADSRKTPNTASILSGSICVCVLPCFDWEIFTERCVGVGSSLLTWFLLFIIPSWGFPGARAQSIQRHDFMLQFNIWFLFAFKSFPTSSRDTGRSIPFVGGTSLIFTCSFFLCCWELHPA